MDDAGQGQFPSATKTDAPAVTAETVASVRAILGELNEFDRQCLEWHYFDGLTHAQIGLLTGRPQPTISSRIRRALQRLRPFADARGLRDLLGVFTAIASTSALVPALPAKSASSVFLAASSRAGSVSSSLAVSGGIALQQVAMAAVVTILIAASGVAYFVNHGDKDRNTSATGMISHDAPQEVFGHLIKTDSAKVADNEGITTEEFLQTSGVLKSGDGEDDWLVERNTCCISVVGSVNGADGKPLPGATVRIGSWEVDDSGAGPAEVATSLTDWNGLFSMTVRDEPLIVVHVEAPHHAPVLDFINGTGARIWADHHNTEPPILQHSFVLEAESPLSGRVVGPEGMLFTDLVVSAEPASGSGKHTLGAYLGASPSTSRPNEEGDFSIHGLGRGQWRLSVSNASMSWGPWLVEAPEEGAILVLGNDRLNVGSVVSGRVLDTERDPVGGAGVAWRDAISRSLIAATVTSSDGHFRLENVSPRPGFLTASAGSRRVTQMLPDPSKSGDIELILPTMESVPIIGTVIDDETEKPVDLFFAWDEHRGRARPFPLEGSGEFRSDDYQQGDHFKVIIEAEGYGALVADEDSIPYGEQDTVRRTYRLRKPGGVYGRIVAGDQSVSGAAVSLGGIKNNPWRRGTDAFEVVESVTEEDGRFEFQELAPGVNVFEITAEGYLDRSLSVTILPGEVIDAGDVELDTGSDVVVFVYDESSGQPLAGKTVRLDPLWGSMFRDVDIQEANTDSAGVAGFRGLHTSDHNIEIVGENLRALRRIEPKQKIRLELPIGSASIHGRLLWKGQSVEADIRLEQARGAYSWQSNGVVSAEQATYRTLSNLSEGEWVMSVFPRTPNLSTKTETVILASGEDLEYDIAWDGAVVTGVVVDTDGIRFEQGTVTATPLDVIDDPPGAFVTDGDFIFENLLPGEWTLTAKVARDGIDYAGDLAVTVPESGTVSGLRVVASPDQTGTLVSWAVRLADGGPVQLAWVDMKPLDPDNSWRYNARGNRDDDGRTEVRFIPPGHYRVEVSDWGYSVGLHEVEILPGQTTEIEDVLFEAGAVRWTLRTANGDPVVDANAVLRAADAGSPTPLTEAVTDDDGVAIFRGLYQGNYISEHATGDGMTYSASFHVTAREISGSTTIVQ